MALNVCLVLNLISSICVQLAGKYDTPVADPYLLSGLLYTSAFSVFALTLLRLLGALVSHKLQVSPHKLHASLIREQRLVGSQAESPGLG